MAVLGDMLKVVDVLVGRPLCLLLAPWAGALTRGDGADPPGRVLVIRPGGIGDAVLFIPMLRELRRAWPAARIDLLAERRNAAVVGKTGLVDEVLRYDVPRELGRALRGRYDLVVDTEQYHCLSAVVALLTRAPRRVGFGTNWRRYLFTQTRDYRQDLYEAHSFLGLADAATGGSSSWDPDRPFYPLDSDAERFAERALQPLAGRRLVAIHPGASIPQRRWPPERYAAVARHLADDGIGIVLLGGPGDQPAARAIVQGLGERPHVDLAGRCSLAEAAAVVARVDVYLSADTGVLHLAYGVGTPTVHLFGPGVLSKWGPPGRRFVTVRHELPCSPCTRYGYTPPCCQGLRCMLGLTPEQVQAAVRAQLDAPGQAAQEQAL
jgi:lipopolysaccharide heptosyltransferase II